MKSRETRETRVAKRPVKGINFSGRVNKAVATNIGESGAAQGVSSKQTVRIVQDGETSLEESTTQVERQ
jgi:hypothetical protein